MSPNRPEDDDRLVEDIYDALDVGEPEGGIVVVRDDAEQPLQVALADRDQPRAAMRIA